MLQEVVDKGVIFLDTDTALKKYPDLFMKYFGKLVPYTDNKYAALNGACWSGGSFIYVPKGVTLDKPFNPILESTTKEVDNSKEHLS